MASPQLNTAELWNIWRRLYPLYCSLTREFVIEFAPSADLEAGDNAPSAESVAQAGNWFSEMDSRIHIHHLRQFAQTSPLMTEQAVSDLLFHVSSKSQKTNSDRDKVDFLLVQVIAMRLPNRANEADVTLDSVSKLLAPLIGTEKQSAPKLVKDLEELIDEAYRASNLNTLFTSRMIERSRELKQASGDDFYSPEGMAAVARFGYVMRRRFFQLMQEDLNSIIDGLRQLEALGVTTIDCRKAQFSVEEPIARIRMICQSWRVMFQAEYSSGQPLCLLVDLKSAVQAAVAHKKTSPQTKSKTMAAAACKTQQTLT